MTFSIGPLQPPEAAAFCDLFYRVFAVQLTPEVRAWKYEQGPRLGSVSLVARDAAGALVGHVGALVFPGLCQGRALPMAQVCDVMVDPGARGGVDSGGAYGRLMAALQAELGRRYPGVLAYGFAGIRPYKLGARMGLYRVVQRCRMGFHPDDGAPQPATSAPGSLLTFQGGWQSPWSTTARPVAWGAPALGRLWQHLGPASEVPRVQRSQAYLEWRYAQHPHYRYQAWELRQWGRALGWMVTRRLPDGRLCMVDNLLPKGVDGRQAATLVARAWDSVQGAVSESLASASSRGLSTHTAPAIGSWDIETAASALLEPIMGCEVRVDRWHSDQCALHFHPGDTDVF